jgi:hypothetical protein
MIRSKLRDYLLVNQVWVLIHSGVAHLFVFIIVADQKSVIAKSAQSFEGLTWLPF